MALYEYHCNDCGKNSELLIFSGDTPKCEHCGSENLERLLSTFAVSAGSGRSTPAPSCSTGGCSTGMCGLG